MGGTIREESTRGYPPRANGTGTSAERRPHPSRRDSEHQTISTDAANLYWHVFTNVPKTGETVTQASYICEAVSQSQCKINTNRTWHLWSVSQQMEHQQQLGVGQVPWSTTEARNLSDTTP